MVEEFFHADSVVPRNHKISPLLRSDWMSSASSPSASRRDDDETKDADENSTTAMMEMLFHHFADDGRIYYGGANALTQTVTGDMDVEISWPGTYVVESKAFRLGRSK